MQRKGLSSPLFRCFAEYLQYFLSTINEFSKTSLVGVEMDLFCLYVMIFCSPVPAMQNALETFLFLSDVSMFIPSMHHFEDYTFYLL